MKTSRTKFVQQDIPDAHARVELKNCRILDVVNGRYFEAGTRIILQDGVIQSMPDPEGDSTGITLDFSIDLQGKTILPGLFNTHCHLLTVDTTMVPGLSDMFRPKKTLEQQLEKNLADCLTHGITHIRDAWQPDLRKNRDLKVQITKGDLPGPRIQQAVVVGPTGSYMLEKVSLMTRVFGGVADVDSSEEYAGAVAFPIDATEGQVRAAVDTAIDERGADVIKIGDESYSFFTRKDIPVMTSEQLIILTDQARARGVRSTMHHTSVESFRRGIEAGVSSLAHVPMDSLLTQGDIDAFKASGCINDPTLSAFYPLFSWKVGGDGDNYDPELIRFTEFRDNVYTFADIAEEYYIPELRTSVMNGYRRCAGGKPKALGIMEVSEFMGWSEKTANVFKNFNLLYENGVLMTTGNDNKSPCTPGMMDLELQMFDHVLKGIPDREPFSGAEAVKIATINSARSMGVDEDFGSIEIGKRADLVILDGDPLEDFRLIGARVDALFMDGEMVINNCGLEVETNGIVLK